MRKIHEPFSRMTETGHGYHSNEVRVKKLDRKSTPEKARQKSSGRERVSVCVGGGEEVNVGQDLQLQLQKKQSGELRSGVRIVVKYLLHLLKYLLQKK